MRVNLGRILARYGRGYGDVAPADAHRCKQARDVCSLNCGVNYPPVNPDQRKAYVTCMGSCQMDESACSEASLNPANPGLYQTLRNTEQQTYNQTLATLTAQHATDVNGDKGLADTLAGSMSPLAQKYLALAQTMGTQAIACATGCIPTLISNPTAGAQCMLNCGLGIDSYGNPVSAGSPSNTYRKTPVIVAKADNTLAYALLGAGLLWALSKNKGQ